MAKPLSTSIKNNKYKKPGDAGINNNKSIPAGFIRKTSKSIIFMISLLWFDLFSILLI